MNMKIISRFGREKGGGEGVLLLGTPFYFMLYVA